MTAKRGQASGEEEQQEQAMMLPVPMLLRPRAPAAENPGSPEGAWRREEGNLRFEKVSGLCSPMGGSIEPGRRFQGILREGRGPRGPLALNQGDQLTDSDGVRSLLPVRSPLPTLETPNCGRRMKSGRWETLRRPGGCQGHIKWSLSISLSVLLWLRKRGGRAKIPLVHCHCHVTPG